MTPQISRLENGVRVVTLAMPGIETAAVCLTADSGSRHEQADVNGVAHMLEHMVFKGTARRSARALSEEIEAVGGSLNAYTGRDQTCFYARVLAQDVPLAIDLVSDLVCAPRLDEADLENEREVVLQEFAQAVDTPDDILFDHLYESAFSGQALGYPVLGRLDSIARIATADLSDWLATHYRGASLVLSAAGRVDHDRVVALAQAQLGALPSGARPVATPACYTGGERRDERPLEQVQIALGLSGVSYTDPAYYPLLLFCTAVGGGMSSRLFQELREEAGLAYSVGSFLSPYAETGLFGIYLGTAPDAAGDAARRALDVVRRTADELSEAELARARAQLKSGLLMGLESPAAMAEQIGRQVQLLSRPMLGPELAALIDGVSLADARTAAGDMLAAGTPSLASVGPAGSVPGLEVLEHVLA